MTAVFDPGVSDPLADAAPALAAAALTLARRFAAGATLWCAAPGAHHHAPHVAVEFLHPVIVGTRSLPAVALVDEDLEATVRLQVRPGDVLLLIGDPADDRIGRLLRRGEAWGVSTVLFATGEGAAPASTDHVIAVGPVDDGGPVLAYHLLWELAHVVFEHPGLLVEAAPVCRDDVCITCSDEGVVAEVLQVLDDHTALVRSGGQHERVDTTIVDGVTPGVLLLAHAGLALAVVEEP